MVTAASADSIHCDSSNVSSSAITITPHASHVSAADIAFPAVFKGFAHWHKFTGRHYFDNDADDVDVAGAKAQTGSTNTGMTNSGTSNSGNSSTTITSTDTNTNTGTTGTISTVPTPEPTSLILLGSGLLLLAALVSRRKRISQMVARKRESVVEA